MQKFRLFLISIFPILFISFIPNRCIADKVLITIDLDFENIAISEEKSPVKSKGESFAYSAKEACFSDSKEDAVPGSMQVEERKKFPYKEIIDYYDEILNQTKLGRRVYIKWELRNYQPLQDIFSREDKGYHLFDIVWFRSRLDYILKKSNDKWAGGACLPTAFYFEEPPKATIIGYGDVDVMISGLRLDIKPMFTIRNIEELVRRDNYKIIISKYIVPKILFLKLSDGQIKDEKLRGQKLEVSGRATLGDTAITTERSPFWYPFDKYSIRFLFTSYFPADVTINIGDIEDLAISTNRKKEFKTKKMGMEIAEETITFFRKDKARRYIWPVIIALASLAVTYFSQKKKEKLLIRLVVYSLTIGAIFFALPVPKNVPKVNILNLAIGIVYLCLIGLIELHQRKLRKN